MFWGELAGFLKLRVYEVYLKTGA